jgi:hypothetical protein
MSLDIGPTLGMKLECRGLLRYIGQETPALVWLLSLGTGPEKISLSVLSSLSTDSGWGYIKTALDTRSITIKIAIYNLLSLYDIRSPTPFLFV